MSLQSFILFFYSQFLQKAGKLISQWHISDFFRVTKISFNKLKQVYGRWNSIFNKAINYINEGDEEDSQANHKLIYPFSIQLIDLFGHEHPISKKFLESIKYSFNYKLYKKTSRNRFEDLPQKDLFEKQPQFMYLNSVTAHRFLHHQKQKQIITKKLNLNKSNLGNSQLNNRTINQLRELFTGQIEQLNLDQNQLTQIPLPESIMNLTSLRSLSLSNNQLSSLPESIGNLIALKYLSLYNNLLKSLPESIGNLKKLLYLQLYNNQLSSLPESIGNLRKLVYLQLKNNQLSSLPESIGNLRALKYLSLYNNQLSSLPESIGNLRKLLYLYLLNNQLSSLPQTIGNLTALQQLYLGKNKLRIIPQSFLRLLKLCELDLSSNQLSALPDSFHSLTNLSQLTSLQQLNVSKNFLEQLPCISKLVNLRILNVSFNPISSSALGLISQNQIKILVDQKQMSVKQNQKCSTKSILFVVDGQAEKKNM